jgi:hypothetical protein
MTFVLEKMMNPYAPPNSNDEKEGNPRDAMKARVSRPATALVIMASIQSVFVAIYLVSLFFVVLRTGFISWEIVGFALGGMQFISLILIAIGGAKLGFLESYRLARLGALLACVPLITPFMIAGIPFGLWSLRLLSDPEVRGLFPDVTAVPKQSRG